MKVNLVLAVLFAAFLLAMLGLVASPGVQAVATGQNGQTISPIPTATDIPTPAPTPIPLSTISPAGSPWSSQNLYLVATDEFSGAAWLEFAGSSATSPEHNFLLYDGSVYRADPVTTVMARTQRPLYLVDMDRNVVSEVGVGSSPHWSPSGKKAIFRYNDSDTQEAGLAIFDLESRTTRRVARFSPDNMYLLGGPFWISDDRVVLTSGTYEEPHSFFVSTVDGTSTPLLNDYQLNWLRATGAATAPRVVGASAASNTIQLYANGILYLLQYSYEPYGRQGYIFNNLLAWNGSAGPDFEPSGPAFVYSEDPPLGAMVFTPGKDETKRVQIPMTTLYGGTYFWTPDGAALLIPGRQGSPWAIVNRDGTGYRALDNVWNVVYVTTTRNYWIRQWQEHGPHIDVFRVAGTD